jgi:hypothetical protein
MASTVLVSQCSDPAVNLGLLTQIAAALEIYQNRDVAAYYAADGRVRVADASNPPQPGEVVALILDDLPDAPGAIAYHDWQGKPDIYAARNMCDRLLTGQYPLSGALSHELAEMYGDWATNLWADDGTGSSQALELCDPVEAGQYVIGGCAMSDFVLPTYFHPGDMGPYSFVQYLGGGGPPAPFTVAPGGYAIVRNQGTGETQLQGSIRPERHSKKLHWSSRSFRRGLRTHHLRTP